MSALITTLPPSPTYRQINLELGIEGTLDENQLNYLAQTYKSVLYLCTDNTVDIGIEGGFESIQKAFPNAYHVPLDIKESCYDANASSFSVMGNFDIFRAVLDKLERPTLIICKSSTRASAVAVAYKAYKESLTEESVLEEAKLNDYKFLNHPGLTHWVCTVTRETYGGSCHPSPHYQRVDNSFGIDGVVDEGALSYLSKIYKSALYLCTDGATDMGITGGFDTVQKAFPYPCYHTPLNSSQPCYSNNINNNNNNSTTSTTTTETAVTTETVTATTPEDEAVMAVMTSFNVFKDALDGLEKPTVIMCRTATRASAVIMAYKAIKEGKDEDTILDEAKSNGYKFVNQEGLTHWVITVIRQTRKEKHDE